MFFHKIPVLAMVIHAGIFAKAVLICLLLFSIISWTIIVSKWVQTTKRKSTMRKFFVDFQNVGGLVASVEKGLLSNTGIPERLALTAAQEYQRILSEAQQTRSLSNVFLPAQFSVAQSVMEQAVAREVEYLGTGLTFLAVAASVSPFIGLLGTVWGITHSFYDIGSMGSTSINIVAPGIAEALITTIFGLVVAIPCAIFYNIFTNGIRLQETQLIDFSTSLIAEVKSYLLQEISGR